MSLQDSILLSPSFIKGWWRRIWIYGPMFDHHDPLSSNLVPMAFPHIDSHWYLDYGAQKPAFEKISSKWCFSSFNINESLSVCSSDRKLGNEMTSSISKWKVWGYIWNPWIMFLYLFFWKLVPQIIVGVLHKFYLQIVSLGPFTGCIN